MRCSRKSAWHLPGNEAEGGLIDDVRGREANRRGTHLGSRSEVCFNVHCIHDIYADICISCPKRTMPRTLKIGGLALVYRSPASAGKSCLVQMLELQRSGSELHHGWEGIVVKVGAASMPDAWNLRLRGFQLVSGFVSWQSCCPTDSSCFERLLSVNRLAHV